MKKAILFLTLTFTILSITSCRDGGLFSGEVTFWYNSYGSTATVQINGKTDYITQWYYNQPDCGSSGCANFTLPAGTYNFTAYSTWNNWSGSITVEAGKCKTMLLY